MYAPGVGIGLIVAFVSENKHSIHYKVQVKFILSCTSMFCYAQINVRYLINWIILFQMADGRNIVVAIRRCEENELMDTSITNTRIFIMQRLY